VTQYLQNQTLAPVSGSQVWASFIIHIYLSYPLDLHVVQGRGRSKTDYNFVLRKSIYKRALQ